MRTAGRHGRDAGAHTRTHTMEKGYTYGDAQPQAHTHTSTNIRCDQRICMHSRPVPVCVCVCVCAYGCERKAVGVGQLGPEQRALLVLAHYKGAFLLPDQGDATHPCIHMNHTAPRQQGPPTHSSQRPRCTWRRLPKQPPLSRLRRIPSVRHCTRRAHSDTNAHSFTLSHTLSHTLPWGRGVGLATGVRFA
jgi:hypothetical protein